MVIRSESDFGMPDLKRDEVACGSLSSLNQEVYQSQIRGASPV